MAVDFHNIAKTWLPDAKLWIRRSSSAMDGEILQTTEAALWDLKMAGVRKFTPTDSLLKQAAKLYLKAQFGYSDESQKYETAYEHLKAAMSLCGDYTTVDTGGADGG
jgi:hypothetical protein